MTDPLTQTLNRRGIEMATESLISSAKRSNKISALYLLDVDNFKSINDIYGHQVGDKILMALSHMLRGMLRENEIIGRLGGDEFVIFLPDIESRAEITALAQRIIKHLGEPLIIDGSPHQVSMSIGISILGDVKNNLTSLITAADIAMYESKSSGKGTFVIYDSDLNNIPSLHNPYFSNLRTALIRNQLIMTFQPIRNKNQFMLEAYLHIKHQPHQKIDMRKLFEKCNDDETLDKITHWCINEATKMISKHPHTQKKPLNIHINLCLKQIDMLDLEILSSIYKQYLNLKFSFDIDHQEIKYMNIHNIEKMKILQQMGIEFIMDNVELMSEYTTANKYVNFNSIKIPIDAENSVEIIQNALDAGQSVILKNIDSIEKMKMTKDNRISGLQGYHIAKPMSYKKCLTYVSS